MKKNGNAEEEMPPTTFGQDERYFFANDPLAKRVLAKMPPLDEDADGTARRVMPKSLLAVAMKSLDHEMYWTFMWTLLYMDDEARAEKRRVEESADREGVFMIELLKDHPNSVRVWFIPAENLSGWQSPKINDKGLVH